VGYEKQRIRLFSRSDWGGPGAHHEEYRLGFRLLDSTRARASYISSTRATRQKHPERLERLAWDGNTELSATRLVRSSASIVTVFCFYEKVIKVKADVAALLMFDFMFDFRHITTEKFALGPLRTIGNSDDPQHPPFCLSSRETLLVLLRAA
jgi:hypothetical protein